MRLPVKINPILAALIVCIGYLGGCKTEDKEPIYAPQFGKEFINLALNQYRDYRVDTLRFNRLLINSLDSGFVYQRRILKKVLKDTTLYTAYEVEVVQRADTTRPWVYKQTDVEFVRFDGAYLVQEGNVRHQLLTFPFGPETRWNLNAFNPDAQTAGYTLKYRGLSADSVASFAGERDSTCLGSQYVAVRFAKKGGLQFRYSYVATFTDDPLNPCAQPVVYLTKRSIKWTLLRYGTL